MTATIAERVAAGAAFLDEHDPGWDRRIDLERLWLGSCANCILGQRHGDYSDGIEWLWSKRFGDDPTTLGFMFAWTPDGDDADDLTAEWKRFITERRSTS